MEKPIELPEILSPWHNDDQNTREQEEQAASPGVGLRDAIDRRPGCGGVLQSASRSDSIMHYHSQRVKLNAERRGKLFLK